MFLFIIRQLLLEIVCVNIQPLRFSEQGMNIIQLYGWEIKAAEIRFSLVKDHHLHILAKIQELSWVRPLGLGWLVKSLLHPPRKLFCSDSSYHNGACQANLTAMLKGRGVREGSLTCIYRYPSWAVVTPALGAWWQWGRNVSRSKGWFKIRWR